MKKFSITQAAAILIWLLPMLYLAWVYSSLPGVVPLHYDIDGKPNGFGSRAELLTIELIMSGIGGGVYLLLTFLPAIDPKQKVKYSADAFQKIGLAVLLLISSISILITYATLQSGFRFDRVILPVIGLFFAFMGNVIYSIKPNYFAGVRTPWTLESEDNWRATHQLAGKLWFVGGIAVTVVTLLLPTQLATIIFVVTILVMAFIPVVYSYVYFKKHQPKV